MPEEIKDSASQTEKEYQDGLNYKQRMGFMDNWPQYERFKAGDQWPAATPRTKSLPRPVFNIIDQIENHKVSTVMNENIRMVFTPEVVPEKAEGEEEHPAIKAAEIFTRNSDTTWEDIKQGELNEEMLEDASNKGTGVLHYYMDSTGLSMEGEVIDPINWFPGNPQQRKVQKQQKQIITSRELISTVKEIAKANKVSLEKIAMIQPDKETQNEGYDPAKIELDDSQKVTVLTKYWRHNSTKEIWFHKVCSGIEIVPPTNTGLRIYPIVVMHWKRRSKCAFGIGDTEGLIPNQKAINFLMAMQLMSVQLTGWPKLIYKAGAIDPLKVHNTPAEIIEDKNLQPGWGVDYLKPGPVSPLADKLVERFVEFTREISGANDASRGEAPGAQLNATAIMLLQKAAGVPIESIRRRFYQAMEDVGRIWEEFWKVKYNVVRPITLKDEDDNPYSINFTGTDYADIGMKLKIDIGPASTYSESLMMSSLDKFLDKGLVTFDQYLKYAPKNVVPFKDRLLKDVEQQKQDELAGAIGIIGGMPPEARDRFFLLPPEQQIQLLGQARNPQSQPVGGMAKPPPMIGGVPPETMTAPM